MKGILKRIQQIPNPISSFLLGWREANGTDTGADESEVESLLPPPLPPVLPNVTNYSHYKSEGQTVSSTVVVPTADGGHRNVGKQTRHPTFFIGLQVFQLPNTTDTFQMHFCDRLVWRQHPCAIVQRSQYFDWGDFQIDEIPLWTCHSSHLFLER